MTPHQVLAVSIRLFAVWLFLYALSNLLGAYVEGHRYGVAESLWPLFSGGGVIVVVCATLWFFPGFIANRILPSHLTVDARPVVFESWFSVGCSLIGVWVLAKAIPALASYGLLNYLGRKLWPDSFVVNPDWLLVSFNVFQLLVGLWLFLGARGLQKALQWARSK